MLPVGVPHRRVKNTRLEQEKRSLGKQNLVGAGVEPLPQHGETNGKRTAGEEHSPEAAENQRETAVH